MEKEFMNANQTIREAGLGTTGKVIFSLLMSFSTISINQSINCGARYQEMETRDKEKRVASILKELKEKQNAIKAQINQAIPNMPIELSQVIAGYTVDSHMDCKLIQAVERDDINEVKRLIELGGDVNVTDKDGRPALVVAIQKKNQKTVNLLINAGANVNTICRESKLSSLVQAILMHDFGIVKCLVNAGADLDFKCIEGRTILVYASMVSAYADGEKILKLLQDINDLTKQRERDITELAGASGISMPRVISLVIAGYAADSQDIAKEINTNELARIRKNESNRRCIVS